MDTFELKRRLKELPMGVVEYHNSIGSTNDRAAELYNQGAPHFSLVVADEQTEGRGRSGRSWFTPPGAALAFSLVLRPDGLQDEAVLRCTGLGALAVCQSIQDIYTIPAMIKWPNDVLLSGKKVCGILAEAYWMGDQLGAIVLGIGINVSRESVPVGEKLNFPATSLEAVHSQRVNRWDLLLGVLKSVQFWWPKLNDPAFIQAWEQHLAFIGEEVQLVNQDRVMLTGRPLGLDLNGWLRIERDRGDITSINIGEIHLRPMVDSDRK